jgi:hypothetical protein
LVPDTVSFKEENSMNRRDFVAGFGKAAGVAGVAVTGVVAAAYPKARDTAAVTARTLRREMKKLDRRIDAMDATQRRIVKALIIVASLSTGLDTVTWLKGDFI